MTFLNGQEDATCCIPSKHFRLYLGAFGHESSFLIVIPEVYELPASVYKQSQWNSRKHGSSMTLLSEIF